MKLKDTREEYIRLVNDKYFEYDGEYKLEILKKLFELIAENEELEEMLHNEEWKKFNEKMWEQGWNNKLTGQEDGSYYCNEYKAREMVLAHEDLLYDALRDYYFEEKIPLEKAYAWDWLDYMIRCYLLDDTINEFLEIWQDEIEPLLRKA